MEDNKKKYAKIAEWQKLHQRVFITRFNLVNDKDVIEKLEAQDNITNYIRGLIEKDIKG